jgi:hypothetical protein
MVRGIRLVVVFPDLRYLETGLLGSDIFNYINILSCLG